jgi:hypothetical protein
MNPDDGNPLAARSMQAQSPLLGHVEGVLVAIASSLRSEDLLTPHIGSPRSATK